MRRTLLLPPAVVAGLLCLCASRATAQTFRVSFDTGLKADRAVGRAEPWVSRDVELVAGKFGKAARIGPRGQLIYAAEQHFQAGRGTLGCWCRIPERPGPLDVQRLVFVQSKERGYWTYLATMEWQESVFRAMAFDFCHGHGWHDPSGLPALKAGAWHHVALVWDQAEGTKFFLDGKAVGSTWGKQAWWERPTPHAIHLSWPGAAYDELCTYDQVLSDDEVAALAKDNRYEIARKSEPPGRTAAERLVKSVGAVGPQHLPAVEVGATPTVIRQARVRHILDDKIPAWKVMDGRMNLFWPEWRAPVLGDVDFSGSELSVALEPGQKLTHLVLRGLVGGCRVFGEREGGHVAREPMVQVPGGLHFLAAGKLPTGLTGLRLPRHEGMKLQEIGLVEVAPGAMKRPPGAVVTPLTGAVELDTLKHLAAEIRTRTLPHERTVLGKATPARQPIPVAPLTRVHFLSEPVAEVLPLDAVELKLRFSAPWKEDVWWLRVQDPVNPRRDLLNLPVRVVNPTPGQETTFHVVLDFWDIMLDPQTRLWIELLPTQGLTVRTGEASQVALWPGERAKVLAEFSHTQSQLAFSYWQLGSEAYGTAGSDANAPGFALLGSITHNRELKLTLEWVRRHVPDHRLTSNLWTITHGKRVKAPVKPRLQPPGAPEWAVWGRELLERFRHMSHHWADRQGSDGQVGGGWNDDTDFPGVFLCLPLLGDTKTQKMFVRIFDGIEKTGYLRHGVSRGPADALHATDFLSWRAHLMLFDYGQPRHVERALRLTRELDRRWTKVDGKGHRRFVSNYFSEDGPAWRPRSEIDSAGLIENLHDDDEGGATRNFLRDPLFCAWYSRNPTVLKFVREMAEGDYTRVAATKKAGPYESYPFYSYFALFGEPRFIDEPVGSLLRDRWSLPIWRRFAERLPDGKRLDGPLLQQAKAATASDESLTTGYVITRDPAYLVRALRDACEELEGGWQFRGGEAGGANDHFWVPGQAALSQLYLGSALTWLRPASIIPPLAVSWQGLDTDVAACVRAATPQAMRVAAYNFAEKARTVRMRVWEVSPGQYRLRQGAVDGNDQFDGAPATRDLALIRGSFVEVELPPRKVHVIELKQLQARPRPELLPDLAVGDGDAYYDKATDRLKVVVHNIGAAPAKDVTVSFEDSAGNLLLQRTVARLDAPLDLKPKTAVVWMPQPLLHPVDRIIVRIDPKGHVEEITKENNVLAWARGP